MLHIRKLKGDHRFQSSSDSLVNETKKQPHRYREQTSGYWWEDGSEEGNIRVVWKKRVIMGLYEIMYMKLLKAL